MTLFTRLRSMDADEIRFRLACETRKLSGLARAKLSPPQWRRGDLGKALAPVQPSDSASFLAARRALGIGDFRAAHVEFAHHFAERKALFPPDPGSLPGLADRVRLRFPEAASDARRRADRILEGRYELLGYEAIAFGSPPKWHADPVHRREAPAGYWATIRYLDPETGDHKIIWELNRHQHWLALGRAYQLTGERRYYQEFVEQLESWVLANPPFQGVNWASMLELGFRVISWTWALHFFAGAADERDEHPWVVDLLMALDRQLTHIEDNLSRYFSPNTHLLGEALALYVAGAAFPELRASAHRLNLGRGVLLEELHRQVNADGGHAELSAHYHRYTTDFYLLALLVAQVTNDTAVGDFETAAHRLASFLRTLADDRGRLPLIGDDDGGQLFPICGRRPSDCRDTLAAAAAIVGDPTLLVSEIPEEVFWFCGGLLPLDNLAWQYTPWPSTALPHSGYYVSRTPHGDHLVFDAGRHGFLNGGHAHADALSLVLTVGGRPVLVDSGTATYTMEPALRDRFRSSTMHNTVVVNGRTQSEPRGPFHWRTTANARAPVWMADPVFDYAEGHHDAFDPVVHSRSVLAVHGFGWIIIDHLLGNGTATAEAFWHVHPSWVAMADERGVTLRHRSGSRLTLACSVRLEVLSASEANGLDAYAPVYGLVQRGTCVRARSQGALPRSFATFVTRDRGPKARPHTDVVITDVEVGAPPPSGWHGAAFSVTMAGQHALVLGAVERAPRAQGDGPGAFWGTATAKTDARVAFAYFNGGASRIIIKGSRIDTAGLVRA